MREVVIVAGVRTPIGNFGGALKDLPPHKMGELVVREAVSRAKVDPRLIDEVIVGSVGHTSDAYNVARAIALMAGLPVRTPAYSVQRNCSSGLQPFVNAYQNIQSEDADAQVVGSGKHEPRPVCLTGHAMGKTAPQRRIDRQYLGGIDRCVLWPIDGPDGREPG